MPKLGGLDVLAAVRRCCPTTHVVIVSGTADRAFLETTIALGAAGFLTKPIVDLADLERLVRSLLPEES
jgi:YesN/AraC family two-component response regulator